MFLRPLYVLTLCRCVTIIFCSPDYRRFQFTFQDAVAKFVPKFPITFRSSEVGRELSSELPNFETNFRTSKRTSEVQSTHARCDICNGVRGTDGFLRKYRTKESYEIITNTLRDNFTSRLSLKLLDPENLDVIFAKSKLPLGSRKILDYHCDLLRNESPLSKPKPQRTDQAGEESSADSKPKVRHCFTQNSCKYKSTSWKFVLRVYASFSDDCENAFLI